MTKPYLTMEEIISIPRLSQPAVAEDGDQVAWVETTPHWDKNEYRKHVYTYAKATGETKAVTQGETQSHSPAWSSLGLLAWLSPTGTGEDKRTEIFVLDQGRTVRVTATAAGVISFQWAPDGKSLYYLAPDQEKTEGQKARKERYGDFVMSGEFTGNCLYRQDLAAGIEQGLAAQAGPKDLRPEKKDPSLPVPGPEFSHVLSFALSPDGNKLAFMAAPSPDSLDLEQASLYLLDLKEGAPRALPLAKPLDPYGKILFSPGGGELCYSRPINEGKWYNLSTVEIYDLTRGSVSQPLLSLDENPYPIRWTKKGLFFSWQDKTDWHVSLLANGAREPILEEPGALTMAAAVSGDGLTLAAITASRDQPFELYLDGQALTQQSRYYQGKTLSRKEVLRWASQDGTEIEGVFITPPALEPGRAYPLLVLVHGGPTWAAFATPADDPYYPYEQFVQRGFILLDVNYRGSSGYGESFRKLNYRNLGLGDYQDVVAGIDLLVGRGLADKDRVGIMGWSQGGYISAMCTTYGDRFKAISVGAGISSWYTYYCNTDIPVFTRHYLGDTPWADEEIYNRTSPINYLDRASTPTLIQHGDSDARVPYANARELYRGLKDMGVPVELVSFTGMSHGANKPGLHRAIMKQNYAWFCHWLLGDELTDFWLPSKKD